MSEQASVFMAKTKLIHGFGSSSAVGQEASRLGISKALVVTDKGIRASGLLAGVEESLASREILYEVFDDVEEDATVGTMHRGALQAKEAKCDGVIVVGGGSPICAGKGIALETTNGEQVSRYEGRNMYSKAPLPVVCVPTTAGSGSDVSAAFVVHDEAQERVYAVAGDDIQPPVSILDPLLLRTCPPRQMIYSGLDALTHCVEAIWTRMATPLTDALAYESIRLIMGNLRRAALTDDLQAKSLQHLASSMANFACGNAGLGIVHGMTMYYRLKVPHGYQNGVLLPYAMEFNMPACEDKLARMAVAIGESPQARSTRELAELALRRLKELYIDLGFPRRFSEEEFPVEEINHMVRTAADTFFVQNNARKTSEQEIRAIYEASLKGWEI
jgi:alcohol dehydrogenase class IV